MTNYTELKRLAEAAESFKPTNRDLINPNYMAKAKAAHIAFADKAPPDVVLSMIAEIDKLRTQNQALWLTDEELNVLWNFAVETGNPTAGNAHLRFARAIIAAINAKESK